MQRPMRRYVWRCIWRKGTSAAPPAASGSPTEGCRSGVPAFDEAQQIPAEDLRFVRLWQAEEADLLQLQRGMEPRTVGTEDHLSGAGAPHRFHDEIESLHAGRVGVDVRVPRQHIEQHALRIPFVA